MRIAGKTRSKRPQLPWGWREHRSGRPRSKDRHRPQLCAKPPHRPPAAQRASAPSLPARRAFCVLFARLRRQCGPASRAGGGRSAHLAGVRSTRTRPSSQAERSDGCPEQSQRAAAMRSCFLTRTGHTRESRRSTGQIGPDTPFWPTNSVGGSSPGCACPGSEDDSFICQGTSMSAGQETKMSSNERECARLHQLLGSFRSSSRGPPEQTNSPAAAGRLLRAPSGALDSGAAPPSARCSVAHPNHRSFQRPSGWDCCCV
jgi:hypothetical protein